MLKGNKIILRKRIKDFEMISGFEKLSNIDLPHPPRDLPVEVHREVVSWMMDMTKEDSVKMYKKLLTLFELPFKTNNASRLYFKLHRTCWYDVLFEVYDFENKDTRV